MTPRAHYLRAVGIGAAGALLLATANDVAAQAVRPSAAASPMGQPPSSGSALAPSMSTSAYGTVPYPYVPSASSDSFTTPYGRSVGTRRYSRGLMAGGITLCVIGGLTTFVGLVTLLLPSLGTSVDSDDATAIGVVTIAAGSAAGAAGIPMIIIGSEEEPITVSTERRRPSATLTVESRSGLLLRF